MNEFTAKKLGEVLAFAEIGNETLTKGFDVLNPILKELTVTDIIEKNKIHAEAIRGLAEEFGMSEIVLKKLEGTGEKLRKMRDMYIADQWDNPTEILEWSGFFEGAALVHWSLVRGAGEAINNERLMLLADEGSYTHHELLDMVESELCSVGQTKGVL